jgi:hypothetical protein
MSPSLVLNVKKSMLFEPFNGLPDRSIGDEADAGERGRARHGVRAVRVRVLRNGHEHKLSQDARPTVPEL